MAFDSDSVLKRLLEWFPGTTVNPADYHVTQAKRAEAFLKTENLKSNVVARSEWKMVARESPAFRAEITGPETGLIRFHVRRHSAGFQFTDPVSSILRSRLLAFLNSFALPHFKIGTARASRETPAGELPLYEKTFSLTLEGEADCFTFETQSVQDCVTGWFPDAVVVRSELPQEEIDRTSALMERLGVTEYELGTAIWNQWRLGDYACPTVELEFYDRGEVPVRCRITPKEISFTFEDTNRCHDFTRQKIVGFLKCISLPEIEISDFEPVENRPSS